MVPNASPPTARATMAAPSQSKCGDARSSRLSGTWVQVAHAASATRGTLMKNAARHEMVSTSSPPISGPRFEVAEERAREVPSDPRQRDVDHRGVEEHDP